MISDYLANKLLDHTLKHIPYPSPETWLALFLSPIHYEDTGTSATEVKSQEYKRAKLHPNMGLAGLGFATNAKAVVFPPPVKEDWGNIVAWAVMDTDGGPFTDKGTDPAKSISVVTNGVEVVLTQGSSPSSAPKGHILYYHNICSYPVKKGDPPVTFDAGALHWAYREDDGGD